MQTHDDTMNADYCLDKHAKHNSPGLFTRAPLGSREISILNGMGLVKPSSEPYYSSLMAKATQEDCFTRYLTLIITVSFKSVYEARE